MLQKWLEDSMWAKQWRPVRQSGAGWTTSDWNWTRRIRPVWRYSRTTTSTVWPTVTWATPSSTSSLRTKTGGPFPSATSLWRLCLESTTIKTLNRRGNVRRSANCTAKNKAKRLVTSSKCLSTLNGCFRYGENYWFSDRIFREEKYAYFTIIILKYFYYHLLLDYQSL